MLKKWKSNKKSRTTKLYHSDRTIYMNAIFIQKCWYAQKFSNDFFGLKNSCLNEIRTQKRQKSCIHMDPKCFIH